MAVPKWHRSKSRQRKKRATILLKTPVLATCPKCGKPVLPHIVCFNCGYYKGMEVIDTLKKLTKKERKAREKEMATKEVEGKEAQKKSLSWEELSKK